MHAATGLGELRGGTADLVTGAEHVDGDSMRLEEPCGRGQHHLGSGRTQFSEDLQDTDRSGAHVGVSPGYSAASAVAVAGSSAGAGGKNMRLKNSGASRNCPPLSSIATTHRAAAARPTLRYLRWN